MTKQQEKVRKEIAKLFKEETGTIIDAYQKEEWEEAYNFADQLRTYLHSQGVVVRVKCPDCEWSQFTSEAVGMTPCCRCNSTGYIYESLVEEPAFLYEFKAVYVESP